MTSFAFVNDSNEACACRAVIVANIGIDCALDMLIQQDTMTHVFRKDQMDFYDVIIGLVLAATPLFILSLGTAPLGGSRYTCPWGALRDRYQFRSNPQKHS